MKILCIGNVYNNGVRLYSQLRDEIQNVTLYRITADEDIKRGNPYLYLNKDDIEQNPNIITINDLKNELPRKKYKIFQL